LQVEDTLFRIPKHHLVGKSEAFATMLSLPQGGNEPEGFSDDKPIQLAGIKKIDFERLLQIIYPIDTTQQPELSINGWISVLALSNIWRMTAVRKTAIQRLTNSLSQISPVERILLGRKYSVAPWVSSGYEELASRTEVVSFEDAERIGVEDTLFRVPKQHLVGKSEAFDSMLSLPQGGSEPEGITDDRPIRLAGIKKIDFERLLQVLHPIDTTKQPELSVNGWVSVLALSSLWRMTVRKTAIERLTSSLSEISPADRIVLGRKYSVEQWISSGCEELATRVEVVSLEEGERVGLSTALRLGHIRESNFMDGNQQQTQGSYYCSHCGYYRCGCSGNNLSRPPFNSHVVKEKVGRLFEAELKDVEAEGAGFE
ncbi:uncharacterized protein EV420DRAFT_1269456, partial [Desarmillaria tabescens]